MQLLRHSSVRLGLKTQNCNGYKCSAKQQQIKSFVVDCPFKIFRVSGVRSKPERKRKPTAGPPLPSTISQNNKALINPDEGTKKVH